uniref:Uncharacterized protein n=1 Tax=uncultured Armatimonadetes bacterium TaxID=157466 RepID=A0A6J4JWP3_9BACT|nr:hypothetical protein AVDCRST_MAG63-4220 [uncultured Armatimonadetes bacterium]
MNRSTGLRTQAASFTVGAAGRFGAISAQCCVYCPPCRTHRRRTATWNALSVLFALAGGIRSTPWATTRLTSSLASGLPGTIARLPDGSFR